MVAVQYARSSTESPYIERRLSTCAECIRAYSLSCQTTSSRCAVCRVALEMHSQRASGRSVGCGRAQRGRPRQHERRCAARRPWPVVGCLPWDANGTRGPLLPCEGSSEDLDAHLSLASIHGWAGGVCVPPFCAKAAVRAGATDASTCIHNPIIPKTHPPYPPSPHPSPSAAHALLMETPFR